MWSCMLRASERKGGGGWREVSIHNCITVNDIIVDDELRKALKPKKNFSPFGPSLT